MPRSEKEARRILRLRKVLPFSGVNYNDYAK
jgi:hypothetical protein